MSTGVSVWVESGPAFRYYDFGHTLDTFAEGVRMLIHSIPMPIPFTIQ